MPVVRVEKMDGHLRIIRVTSGPGERKKTRGLRMRIVRKRGNTRMRMRIVRKKENKRIRISRKTQVAKTEFFCLVTLSTLSEQS